MKQKCTETLLSTSSFFKSEYLKIPYPDHREVSLLEELGGQNFSKCKLVLKCKALRRLGVVPKRVNQKMLLTSKVLCFNVKVLPLQILMDSFKEHRYEMHVDISTCELIAFRKFHEFN